MAKKNTAIPIDDINVVTKTLSQLAIRSEFVHMKKPVEMILGGLLIPYLMKQTDVDTSDAGIQKLLGQFTKEKVKAFFNPKAIEREVIKEVPVEVEIEKIVEILVTGRPVFRRIKSGVSKEKRIKRTLDTLGRDTLIRWWNVNQRLVPSEDPVCATLTDQVNVQQPMLDPLSSMQIAGYFSHLCRLGRATSGERDARIAAAMERGDITVVPEYSAELMKAIQDNWEKERADEAERSHQHAELLRRRASGDRRPVLGTIA
jgi:hypothetical protein